MDNRFEMFDLLREENKLQTILVYPAITTETDSNYHEKRKTFLNPIAIEAFVTQVSEEALIWKYYGTIPRDSKKIIAEPQWYETLKSASKITINDIEYRTLWDDSKSFNILKRENYIICVVVRADAQ